MLLYQILWLSFSDVDWQHACKNEWEYISHKQAVVASD